MIEQLIHKAFNSFEKKEIENDYTPTVKVQSTVKPDKDHSFNEVFEHVAEQLRT